MRNFFKKNAPRADKSRFVRVCVSKLRFCHKKFKYSLDFIKSRVIY